MNRTEPLSGDLLKLQQEIYQYAVAFGLDFFETRFEVCNYDTINILAAQGGFPSRYPHWRFGMDYDQLSKGQTYGTQKIYEMVINTNPAYAYLLKANHWVDQKTVIAHVYGHVDFFKNNFWFSNTNRNMMDVCANHGTKIRRYMEKHGQDKVELFIDRILSIENLLDVHYLFETPQMERKRRELEDLAHIEAEQELSGEKRSQALKSFMNTLERHERQERERTDKEKEKETKSRKEDERPEKFPAIPQRDVMKFLADHAPIKEWESDILSILREEAYYFLPQRMTKIMNEGWASYWHSTIMTEKALNAKEIVDFADHHAGVMQMSRQQLNPYKLGIELFRDIEYRWNTGKFGKDYNECSDIQVKTGWDQKLSKGREKIFEVRRTHNDITFIDEFLTPEFCERAQLFTYKYNARTGRFEIDSRDFAAIKVKLLAQLTNFGQPIIEVEDANFGNRGELLLVHRHHGVDLDMGYGADTMKNVYAIWKRPVNLRTKYDDKEATFVFDGKELRPR